MSGEGREQAPAVVEERGEAGGGAGVLGAGEGMAGDEVDARRNVWPDGGDNGALDRADVGDGGAGGEDRGDLGGDRAHGTHRDAEDDEVGAGGGLGGGADDLPEAEAGGLGAGGGAAGSAGDPDVCARTADGVADRRGDQPEADEGDVAVAHQARTFMKAAMASATAAQPSASPTVMRRAAGRL